MSLLLPKPRINIGALIIRVGFWGPLYYNYNKDPQNIAWAVLEAPILHPPEYPL